MADRLTCRRIHPERKTVPMDRDSFCRQNQMRASRGEPLLHRCSVCGGCGEWTSSWSWYGSQRDLDDGAQAEFCSSECQQGAIREMLWPKINR